MKQRRKPPKIAPEDDHPVRNGFAEAVAYRCLISEEDAMHFITPISTAVIDVWWNEALKSVVDQFSKGDKVATFYPPKSK